VDYDHSSMPSFDQGSTRASEEPSIASSLARSAAAKRDGVLTAAGAELIPRLRGVSHAVAFIVAVVAAVVVIERAPAGRGAVAATVYGVGLVALFGGSALYHRWPGPSRFKPILRRVDHGTIFVFIAASYTPIALIVLHGPLRWVVLAMAWIGAAAGIALSLGWIDAPRSVAAGSYLVLGWIAVIAVPQLLSELAPIPVILIASGAVLYTSGAIVYALRRPDPWPQTFGFHEIFHALVILAAAAYYIALVGWMLPTAGA
jgi:hemolysin III